ncbi:hypothetical protein [Nannocystis sp.]|uniref:hypothetical protein n=1 Tax=Nannocystis sp. TaxID=1962667 RepID=UPI0024253349|nr:hypothetical protein [Nannocystis sp.]MBK7827380.1 hypothetical protein [Nannocystis sp.]MBK9756264.1 hypothetical protein [Nannocystis sp.]
MFTIIALSALLGVNPMVVAESVTAPGSGPTFAEAGSAATAARRNPRGYAIVSPGVLTLYLNTPIPMYSWGVEAGFHSMDGRIKLQAGGFFEHTPFSARAHATPAIAHWLRLGPRLRLGGGNAKNFGYGTIDLALDLMAQSAYIEAFTGGDRVSMHGAVGGGAQRLLLGRILLGGEARLLIQPPGRHTGLMTPNLYLDFRLLIGVTF